jgi:hypothetical protein
MQRFKKIGLAAVLAVTCGTIVGCVSAPGARMEAGAFSVKDISGFHLPEKQEELFGTWVNPLYETQGAKDSTHDPKLVIHDTGFLESFSGISLETTNDTGVMIIVKKWRRGDHTWYVTFYRSSYGGDSLSLARLSEDNTVMESFWVSPYVAGQEETLVEENMSPDHPHYKVYRRQTYQ